MSLQDLRNLAKSIVQQQQDKASSLYHLGLIPILENMVHGDGDLLHPAVLMEAVNGFCNSSEVTTSTPAVTTYLKLWGQDWVDEQQCRNPRVVNYLAANLASRTVADLGKYDERNWQSLIKRYSQGLSRQRKQWVRERERWRRDLLGEGRADQLSAAPPPSEQVIAILPEMIQTALKRNYAT